MKNYEIKIKSDGSWFHKGEKIKRLELVKLLQEPDLMASQQSLMEQKLMI